MKKSDTTESHAGGGTFAANLSKIAEQSQRVVQEFMSRNAGRPSFGTGDPLHMGGAFAEWFARALSDPKKLMELQMDFWQDTMHLWQQTTQKFLGEQAMPVIE